MHWHGRHVTAEMDGTPHQMINPGETWTAEFDVKNPASTLWYHPHPHGETAIQTWMGISGMIVAADDDDTSLPNEDGVDDIPQIIQDRRFRPHTGEFDRSVTGSLGTYGNRKMANGTLDSTFAATRTLTRFRLLNGSNTRWYNLAVSDSRPFMLVRTEAGALYDGPA